MEGIGLGSYPHDIDFLNVHKLKEDLPQLEEDAAKLRSFIRQRVKSIVMDWRNSVASSSTASAWRTLRAFRNLRGQVEEQPAQSTPKRRE